LKPKSGFKPSYFRTDLGGKSLAPYVRTLPIIIEAMLELGQVTAEDVLYDLGCGDGRIVLTAAQQKGCRGLGVDIDPKRIEEAHQKAAALELTHLVEFKQQDLLTLDFSPASVVTLYLMPKTNLLLRNRLQSQLSPGSRIITHSFDMGDWPPTRVSTVEEVIKTYKIYCWQIER
jgi:SAM-dependent methyltransferase